MSVFADKKSKKLSHFRIAIIEECTMARLDCSHAYQNCHGWLWIQTLECFVIICSSQENKTEKIKDSKPQVKQQIMVCSFWANIY